MNERKDYHHKYYLAHREHILGMTNQWAKDNRERINANQRYRYRTDPDYRAVMVERQRNYRVRKAAGK